MKRFLLMILVLAFAGTAAAADLQWEYSQEDEAKIKGFRIHYKDINLSGTAYKKDFPDPSLREVRDITTTLKLWPSHKYSFTCRAYADTGESGDSNEVSWLVPPWKPGPDVTPIKIEIPAPATIMIFQP